MSAVVTKLPSINNEKEKVIRREKKDNLVLKTTIATSDIKLLINMARTLGEVDSPRSYATVIHVCKHKEKVCAIATNGFGLLLQVLPSVDLAFIPDEGFSLDVRMLREVAKVLPLSLSIKITYDPKSMSLQLETSRGSMSLKLSAVKFPNWEDILKDTHKVDYNEVALNPHMLMKVIKGLGRCPSDGYITLKIKDSNEVVLVRPSWAKDDFAIVPPIKKM